MGIGKWILKNGLGSPGSTTKVYSKLYNALDVRNHSEEWENTFKKIFNIRVKSSIINSNNLLLQSSCEDILSYSKGDLALFVFIMMFLETKNFRDAISSDPSAFCTTCEVIFEVVESKSPKGLLLNRDTFQNSANTFIYNFFDT